jgi:hypothetical protein
MARMSPLETKLWRDRLLFAENFWRASGCTGESVNGRPTINTFAEAYRGHQWPSTWAGLSQSELVTVNLMFSVTNTLIASLSARAAKPIVKPKGQALADDDAARRAALNEVLLGSVANDLKFKRQVDMATLDAAIFPAGFIRHGFTPREEKYTSDGHMLEVYDKALPDMPWVRRVRISDIRIDPMAASLFPDEDARWCAFRDICLLEDVKRNPGLISRKDLRPTYVLGQDRTKDRALQNEGGPDESQLVELWTVYDKVERKWFVLSPGSEMVLREPEDWPIPWDSLPYDTLFFNANPLSMMPIALPEIYFDLCMELNKVRTMMSALTKRMRRVLIVNKAGLADGAAEKMMDADLAEWFESNGADPRTVAAAIEMGHFPRELLEYDARIREDLYEVTGISAADRGQAINIRTGTEAQDVQSGATTLKSRAQEKVEEFWGNIFRKNHRAIQFTQTDEILLPIFDQKGASALLQDEMQNGRVKIAPNDLQGEFHYGVQTGSTLPENPQQELSSSIALYQIFKDDPMVNQRMLKHDILVGGRRDADRLLATSDTEMGQNLSDLGTVGVGRSLAAPEKPGQEPGVPPIPGGLPKQQKPAAANPAQPQPIPPELMAALARQGGTGVPQ